MTDTITRWECQECGGHDGGHRYADDEQPFCPGVPVERTYVAVDALLSNETVAAAAHRQRGPRDTIEAAINAVTGEATDVCEECHGTGDCHAADCHPDGARHDCSSCAATGEKP